MKIKKRFIMALLTSLFALTAHSATLVIENGQLAGADDIEFDGYTGSVRFVDGTCQDLFNGCDEASDIVFDALTDTAIEAQELAFAAITALRDQVFDANPLYDFNVELTAGCEAGTVVALVWCGMLTPYNYLASGSVDTVAFTNRDDSGGSVDTIGGGAQYSATNSFTIQPNPTQADRHVYAVWSVTPVPLPAAGPLFGAVIGTFGLWASRRKKSEA